MSKLFLTALIAAFLFPVDAFAQASVLQFCALQGQVCQIQRHQVVFYGARGIYAVTRGDELPSTGFVCDNSTFGDPIPSQTKACYVHNTPGSIQRCSGDRCDFNGYRGSGLVILSSSSGRGRLAAASSSGSPCHGQRVQPFDLGSVSCEWFAQDTGSLERDRQSAVQGISPNRWSQSTTLAGVVTDTRGMPISGASITVRDGATGGVILNGNADTQGHFFSVHGFAPGQYTIAVSAPGFTNYTLPLTVQPVGHYELGSLQLQPSLPTTGAVSGRITDDRNQPIRGTTAELIEQSSNRRIQVHLQADGQFFLEDLRPGTYSLVARAPGFNDERKPVSLRDPRQISIGTIQLKKPGYSLRSGEN